MTESPGALIAELRAQRDLAAERVQELEAEVERLKAELREHAVSFDGRELYCHFNGGGRESGVKVEPTGETRPPPSNYSAANPAACSLDGTDFCWIHGRWHDHKAFLKAAAKAARKERKT